MSADRPPSSSVDTFFTQRAPRHEPEVERKPVRDAFEEVRAPRMRGREGITLDVRLADGRCSGFSYAYLIRVDFAPGDSLILRFAGTVITAQGRRLRHLYKRLLEHRVEALQEGTEAEEGLKPDEAAHIDSITITDNKED